MPAALGHLGRCWPSIGLRFPPARRNAAPRTVPHGPRPDGAGPTAAPIARTPARHAHGHPAAHPIAAAGSCRGCSPAAVTLCANRAALARAFIYNLFAMANRCGVYRFFSGPNLGARSGAHALAVSCRYRCASHRTATACDGGRVVRSNVGNVAAIGHGAPLRACEGTAGTLARCLRSWHWVRAQFPQPPDKANALPVGWPPNLRSRISVCGVWFPHALIMLPFLRPFRRSLSERTKARCQPVVIVSHRAAFPPCQVWRALSPIIARA